MKLLGLGAATPALAVSNADLAAFLDTSDEWIATRTGIRERRILSGEQLEELAAEAGRRALADAGVRAEAVDFIICSNVYSSYMTPGLGCVLRGRLGARCASVDINAACAGFLYGLDMAQAYLKAGRYRTILLVCAESPTRMMDWTDRSTCVLFGDAAAAAVLTADGPDALFRTSNSEGLEFLYAHNPPGNCPYIKNAPEPHAVRMNGQEVYKYAVSVAVSDIRTLLEEAALSADDISHYVMHQANLRIVEAIRARLKQPKAKFPHNMERYGNTSSASVPLLLTELRQQGKLKPGDKLAISAFGAGLTAGSCIMEWS